MDCSVEQYVSIPRSSVNPVRMYRAKVVAMDNDLLWDIRLQESVRDETTKGLAHSEANST